MSPRSLTIQYKNSKRGRLLVVLLSLIFFSFHLGAQTVTVDNINYSLTTLQTATCTGPVEGYKGSGDLVIPDFVEYNGTQYPVTFILWFAFDNCTEFTGSLTIGNSVTGIGQSAFRDCSGFTGSLTIPDSVTEIGEDAFRGCSGFTGSLTIPDSVTEIGGSAFRECSGFTGSLTIGNSVPSIGDYAFAYCSGFTGSLTIGNSVSAIGSSAFYNCSGFTGSLTIPDSVSEIGHDAFSGCSDFTGSLTIGNSVTEIGHDAFSGCSGFTGSLTIPDSVTEIGFRAFYGCSGFTGSLNLGNSLTTIGSNAFYGCSGFIGSLTIPDSVTEIQFYAFSNCSGFTGSLAIPDSVTEIGEYAFYNCSGFTGSLTIGNSVTLIGFAAFYDCSGFTGSLTIGNSVSEIGSYAFLNDVSFEKIISHNPTPPTIGVEVFSNYDNPLYVPAESINLYENAVRWSNFRKMYGIGEGPSEGMDFKYNGIWYTIISPSEKTVKTRDYGYQYGHQNLTGSLIIPSTVDFNGYSYTVIEIGESSFSWCSSLTGELKLPDTLITIGNSAFYGCYGFTGSLAIPDSVTSIGNYAFSDCLGFTDSLTIPDSVTSIGNYAFIGCSGFTGSLTIPNSVTTIGEGAFYGCSGFTGSLTIPDSVTSIGNYAFQSCSGFTGSLTIPDSITAIGSSVFEDCSGFTGSLAIPNSVTTISSGAFCHCSGFTGSLIIPDSVTEIGGSAFQSCSGFTGSLTIPDSVTSIGNYAFLGCYGFTGSLTIPDSVTTIGEGAFYLCYGFNGSLTISDSVTSIGQEAFYGCSGFTGSLTIPDSVISIGPASFMNCTGFNGSLTIGNSVTTIGERAFQATSFKGELTIGSSVKTIDNLAFWGAGFEKILSYNSVPPVCGEDVFYYYSIPLYVPDESVELYKETATWGTFENIDGLSYKDGPKSISVNPSSVEIKIGETLKLQVDVDPASMISEVVWSSSDTSIATVSNNGTITALSLGVVTITATCWNISATCEVTVVSPKPIGITLSPLAMTLREGETGRYSVTFSPANAEATLTWSSADPNIAVVNGDGEVTARGPGMTVIAVTSDNGVTGMATVKVIDESVSSVTITPDNVTLEIEGTTQLTARISPDNAESDIMWSSLDPTIATVDETGLVRAVDKGSTIIYATADNGVTGMAIVTVVNSREASSVTIDPGNLEIIVGGEEQLMAVVSPATSDTGITWLSSDPSVAEVTDEGVVIAVSPGLAVIYALADNGMTGLATVRVVTNEVTSVTIDPDILTLEIQMTGQFRAYVEPAVAQTTLTWTSNDPAIATVDADGVVEGKSHGFTVITATADNGVVGMAIAKVIDPNAEDNPDFGYGDNGVYVSAVRIREGDQLGLFAERPTGYENNDWRYEWYLRGDLKAEGKNVMVPAGKESGWTGTVQDITTETYQADITNGAGAEIILDVPEVRVYSRPLTPSELTRKGDGATCSFIAMSSLSDTELEKLGYSFVFGYYDEEGVSHVISNGKSRYCHTTKEIYNNEGYRFWVYTAWTFPDGATITSGLRYLDGSLDENFNRSDFNFSTENEDDIEGRSEVHVYTVDGQTVGKDVDKLAPGIYIIYERNGKQVSTRKIIKR